jgi:hypothetical protein
MYPGEPSSSPYPSAPVKRTLLRNGVFVVVGLGLYRKGRQTWWLGAGCLHKPMNTGWWHHQRVSLDYSLLASRTATCGLSCLNYSALFPGTCPSQRYHVVTGPSLRLPLPTSHLPLRGSADGLFQGQAFVCPACSTALPLSCPVPQFFLPTWSILLLPRLPRPCHAPWLTFQARV